MAKQFGSQIDLQKIPVLGIVVDQTPGPAGPTSPVNGQLWFDNSQSPARMMVRENGTWQLVSGLGGTTPAGPAGGDLTGTYPNPTIGAGKVTSSHILDGTIVDGDVAAANKDGVAGTPSLRTLGLGALQALAGNTPLNSITVPAAAVNMNGKALQNVLDPAAAQDAATKAYVDNLSQGLETKGSVRAATTANLTLSAPQTVDGVSLIAGDRVLVKNQTTPSANGIYVVAAGAWTRATDMDAWAEVPGAFTFVESGSSQADTGWVSTADPGGTLGTTSITWAQFSSAGNYVGGAGLTLTGTTFDVVGTANRISVAADAVDIATNYAGQASITTLGTVTTGVWNGTDIAVADGGTGASTPATARVNLGVPGKWTGTLPALTAGVEATFVHGLGELYVMAQYFVAATGREIDLDWHSVSTSTIGVTADVAYAANAIRAVVVG